MQYYDYKYCKRGAMTFKYFSLVAVAGLCGCAADANLGIQDVRPAGLELACSGSGSQWQSVTSYSNNRNWEGKTTSTSSLQQTPFSGAVRYMEAMSGPMLSLPEGMMPALNVGGGGKWRAIKDLAKTDARISGRVAIGGLGAEAAFVINRRTGDIKVESVSATFSGVCTAVAASAGPKF